MTALTVPAQPGQDAGAGLRPVPWQRMLWVTWRQQRAALIGVLAVLGGIAVFLLVAGLKVHHDYAAIANCLLSGPRQSTACQQNIRHFNSVDWTMGNTVNILINLLPPLLGAFVGAPLLGRELENGTFRYAWTQGLRRERQAITKLVLVGVTVAVLAGAFGQLFAWFFDPFLRIEEMNVLAATVFATRGIAFAFWTLAAFAIGAFLGMLLRRMLPAMAATLGVYLVLALAAWDLRKYYPVALVTSDPHIDSGIASPSSPWILGTWFTGPGGHPASQSVINQYLDNPSPKASLPPGYAEWTRYIPVSHFWPMQLLEAGWLLVLSILLVAATVRLVRRRAA